MFKDIISDQEGQNLFPGIPTYVKGTPTATPLTTKNVKGPMIGVTADGAFNMYPGQDIATLGRGVLEIPVAQMGGSQQDMIMKLIMAFAQSRGQDPNELMAKLKQLPQDKQQQAIEAIAQTVQEEQMQQQQMMQQPMAKDGGCIDCQEQYPQAQNLNWFYKAEGGTAFPAANRYPESWAGYSGTAYAQGGMTEAYPQANVYPHMYPDGGSTEAFPQAQTYLPYDRPGETTPNFMVEYGGQTIDDIYQIMKKGGLNFDAKKKKGGELSDNSFAKYLMKNGGYLPKHQGTNNSQVGPSGTFEESFGEMNKQMEDYGILPSLIPVDDSSVSNPFEGATGRVGRTERRWQREQDKMMESQPVAKSKSPQRIQRSPYYNYGMTAPEAAAVIGQSSKNPFVKKLAAGINIAGAFNTLAGDPLKMDTAYIGRDGGVLPKHQTGNVTGGFGGDPWWQSGTSALQQSIMNTAQQEASKQIPTASWDQTTTGTDTMGGKPTGGGEEIQLNPGDNAINQKKSKTRRQGDIIGSMRATNALGAAGSLMAQVNAKKEEDKLKGKINTTDRAFQTDTSIDRGDYETNRGTFRPDQYTYAQKNVGYTDQSPLFWSKMGGGIPELKDGMEIDLDMYPEDVQREIIYSIYAAGGSVEYI